MYLSFATILTPGVRSFRRRCNVERWSIQTRGRKGCIPSRLRRERGLVDDGVSSHARRLNAVATVRSVKCYKARCNVVAASRKPSSALPNVCISITGAEIKGLSDRWITPLLHYYTGRILFYYPCAFVAPKLQIINITEMKHVNVYGNKNVYIFNKFNSYLLARYTLQKILLKC